MGSPSIAEAYRTIATLLPGRLRATSYIAILFCSALRLVFQQVKLAFDLGAAAWRKFRLTQSTDPQR